MKRESGFSLIELMVAMTVFILAMGAASNVFLTMLTQFKQQSKVAESGIEGVVGLEILRRDIEHAGFGLPWVIPAGTNYTEPAGYSDAPAAPPRAVVDGNDVGLNGSDYLVVKSVMVGSEATAQRWTRLGSAGGVRDNLSGDPFQPPYVHQVMVIDPGTTALNARTLVAGGGAFGASTYGAIPNALWPAPPETFIVYGLTDTGATSRPFNRADYYLSITPTLLPTQCAPGTGVLVKAVMSQIDGTLMELPLIDCVADMQVRFGLDTTGSDTINTWQDTLGAAPAQDIRNQLKEVRLFLLAQEGQKHMDYIDSSGGTIDVGGSPITLAGTVTDYQNYRWKVHTLAMRPGSLR